MFVRQTVLFVCLADGYGDRSLSGSIASHRISDYFTTASPYLGLSIALIAPSVMNISKEEVESLYRQAGQEVHVEDAQFLYEGEFVDTPGTRKRIRDAAQDLGLGFELQEFQVNVPFDSSASFCF